MGSGAGGAGRLNSKADGRERIARQADCSMPVNQERARRGYPEDTAERSPGEANQPSTGWIRRESCEVKPDPPRITRETQLSCFFRVSAGFHPHKHRSASQKAGPRRSACGRCSQLLEGPPPSPDCHPTEGGQRQQSYVCMCVYAGGVAHLPRGAEVGVLAFRKSLIASALI